MLTFQSAPLPEGFLLRFDWSLNAFSRYAFLVLFPLSLLLTHFWNEAMRGKKWTVKEHKSRDLLNDYSKLKEPSGKNGVIGQQNIIWFQDMMWQVFIWPWIMHIQILLCLQPPFFWDLFLYYLAQNERCFVTLGIQGFLRYPSACV